MDRFAWNRAIGPVLTRDAWDQAARELVDEFSVPSRCIGFLAGAALIVIVGPFGTFDLPFQKRASFWVSWFAVVWIVTTILFASAHHFRPFPWVRKWHQSAASLVFSIPIAAFFGVFLATFFFSRVRINWENLIAEAAFLSPIVACIVVLLHMTARPKPMPDDQTRPVVGAEFFKRLPHEMGQHLISISVSDHYLKVETKSGETLILGSLSEAVEQLRGYKGCQVHRSHWVSLHAVKTRKWVDQKMQLSLENGTTVPVGRSYRKRLLTLLAEV